MGWWAWWKRIGHVLRRAAERWAEQGGATMAACIAFYAAFSLAPSMILVMLIAALIFGREAVQGQLFQHLSSVIGAQNAGALQDLLVRAWKAHGAVPTLTSIVAIIFASSSAFTQTYTALNAAWDENVRPPPAPDRTSFRKSMRSLLRSRLRSFGLVVSLGVLLIVLLVLDSLMHLALLWLQSLGQPLSLIFDVVRVALMPLMLAVVFGAVLRVLPDAPLRTRDVAAGAIVSAVLFMAGKWLFAIYLIRAGTANIFGAAGSLAVLLMWLYYSAAVFLYGAHFGAAWTRARDG